MTLHFFFAYVILFLNWQQELLALQEKLSPIQNFTGCDLPDTNTVLNEVRPLVRETINPYLRAQYGPVCECGPGLGWTTIVDLDMSDTSQNCPTNNWRLINSGEVRACGRTAVGCQSATFPSGGVSYSQVCGQIFALQFGHPDGLNDASRGIEDAYVDGISLTYGSSPRKHIWTFVDSVGDNPQYRHAHCPCTNVNLNIPDSVIPSFVGNNYFCDTANSGTTHPLIYYPGNPLFDGQGCSAANSCCTQNNPPWFCTSLPSPTTDSIEVRICGTEAFTAEDTVITRMQLYVQ